MVFVSQGEYIASSKLTFFRMPTWALSGGVRKFRNAGKGHLGLLNEAGLS